MLLNLEWRKFKGLEELMRALNTYLDTKCGNRTFLNINRLPKITKRERNKLLLSVKNLQELSSSPFLYIAPTIPCPLLREVAKVNIMFFLIF